MEKQDLESGKKLVSDSNLPTKDTEVKFVPSDPRNGDAKIDIENLKCVFTGMGKEELMKYADDPFWVRTRWILFIGFWAIWVAMLAGAIAIIVLAPKCTSAPKLWWETSPMYKVDARSYAGGKIKDIEPKLDFVKSLGVKNLILSSVLKSGSTDEPDDFIEDYKSVDPSVGTIEEFESFVKAAQSKDLKVELAFVPNHSSNKHPWFVQSEKKVEPYTDYYVWKPQNGLSKDGTPVPPNNWVSVNGGPAWTWSETRGEFYYHHFGENQPDLNFRNPTVNTAFKAIFDFWLNKGVTGFELEKVQYLFEDKDLKEEPPKAAINGNSDKYGSIDHKYTVNQPEVPNFVADWKKLLTARSGILIARGLISSKGNAAHLNARSFTLDQNISAANLYQDVKPYLDVSPWPVWQWSCPKSKKETCKPDILNGLQLISLLLPGTPVINAGQELSVASVKSPSAPVPNASSVTPGIVIAANGNDPISVNNASDVFKIVAEARNSTAFLHGSTEVRVLKEAVFAFTRIKIGNPSYLVAFNPNVETVAVNFSDMKNVPDKLTVEVWSKPLSQFNIPAKAQLDSKDVTIPPGTALVCSFTPHI